MVKEYNLSDIDYEKWDNAFDDFNAAKIKFPNLKFETWYHQQKHFINHASELKNEPINEDEIYYVNQNDLLQLLQNLFLGSIEQMKNEERDYDRDEEDEWDPWDEDHEDPNENLL